MKAFKVVGAYVTLRVKNELGQGVLLGFHQGATVPDSVDSDDLDRHVRKGLVAEDGTQAADLFGVPAGTPVPDEPPSEADEAQSSSRPRRSTQKPDSKG